MTSIVRSRISTYAVAVGLTALAFVLTLLLGYFIQRAAFILFFPAVILSAWVGGLGPGLVATALSALAAAFSSLQSPALFTAGSWGDLVLLGLFVLVAGLISSLQAARQRAEEWFQVTLTSIGDAVIVTDLEGRVVLMNPEAERLSGWSQAEAHGRDLVEVFRIVIVNEHTRQTVDNPVTAVLRLGVKVGLANHTILLGKDGVERPIDDSAAPIRDRYGRLRGVVLVFRDITERRRAEQALVDSEERLRLALEAGRMGTWDWNMRTNELTWSAPLEAIHGLAPGSFPGTFEAYMADVHPDDLAFIRESLIETIAAGREHLITYRIVLPDGSIRWVEGRGRIFTDEHGQPVRMSGVCMDIDARKQAEEQLQAAFREKEVLLKEVHHRVKNNLQIISSLLSLQADGTSNPHLGELLQDSQHRVHAMALIHEQLYQAGDLSKITFADYIQRLAEQVVKSYHPRAERVTLRLQLADVALAIDQAIPCGLILNELVTNSLKYAFPGERSGEICIGLRVEEDQRLCLIISDDGVGFPSDLDFPHTTSLGLQLVCALTEQLQGILELDRTRGTAFQLTFPLEVAHAEDVVHP